MPPIELVDERVEEPQDSASGKPVIGIIYPPPEVRNIVDKTASFVARNGPEFESRIRQNELNNPKFNFLNPNDPYHAYYQHKVKEFKEGKGQEPVAPKGLSQQSLTKPQQEVKQIIEPIVPKEPPPESEFIADPPSISAFDLDVVKLTAQFVARNGRQFLTSLMNREKNYQFDFLRPQHSLFNYFTKLVEQYTKVLIPPKDLLPKLRKEADNPKEILNQVKYRVEWAKYQEREKRKEEEAAERERVAYASVDWHDFVVVETVDFHPNEPGNFPPPTTPEEVGARLLAQERHINHDDETVEMEVESDEEMEEGEARTRRPGISTKDDTQVQDMEEDSDDEDQMQSRVAPQKEKAPPPPPPPPSSGRPQPPPLPPQPDEIIIRKDYNPKAPKVVQATPAPDEMLISPITGEKIPADKIQEHMRIGLLDRRWIEQRDRALAEKQEQQDVFAPGSSIGSHLKHLAERRTDIFGHGAEETQIGKKIGEEDRKVKEKVTWDGHTASMDRVTQKARENISIEEQIAVIHKVKGLLPDEEKEKIGPALPKGPPPSKLPPPLPPQPSISTPSQPSIPSSGQMAMTTKANVNQPAIPGLSRPPIPPPPTPVMMQPRPQMMVMPPRPPMQMRPPVVAGIARPPIPPSMPGPPMPPHMGGGYMQAPMTPQMPQSMGAQPTKSAQDSDEPPSKKAKTEDNLIPEEEFLKKNKGPVTFKVAVPNMPEKAEWKLNGQALNLTMPITDSVSVIKAKLHEALGMPVGKMKLQYDGLFIKDSNTLAFYNFTRNAVVQLQLKQRGGRK